MCTRSVNTNIIGLLHNTDFKNITSILESGYLYTDFERHTLKIKSSGFSYFEEDAPIDYTGQYPGVYFAPLTVNMLPMDDVPDLEINYSFGPIYLVFSVALLEREDYHINERDSNGVLYYGSYDASYLDNNELFLDFEDFPEVVFHNKVSLEYLQQLWVETEENASRLRQEVPDMYKDLIKVFRTVPDRTYFENCETELKWDYNPNYCHLPGYWIFTNEDEPEDYRLMDLEDYNKIALNCGVNENFNTREELFRKIEETDSINEVLKSPRHKRSPFSPFGQRGMVKTE